MNMPLIERPVAVRVASANEAACLDDIMRFVAAHPEATPFHDPRWNLAVAEGCGQRAHWLVAEHGDGSLAGVLPLTEIHSPLFGRALVSSGFGVGGGILADRASVVAALADAAWSLAERLSCPSVELRGGPVPGPGWETLSGQYLGHVRALATDDEAELLAIPRKQRAEVRKALALPLEVTVDRDVVTHHRVYAQSVRNLGTPVFPRRLFERVLDRFGDQADILTVRHQGEPVASVLSLYWRQTVYPYWGGGTAAARALRANDLMYFALMRHARARDCAWFDFGRSKAGTGAAAFKKNWGFEGEALAYHHRTAPGAERREINPLSPRYRLQVAAWQRLPQGIADLIGPWIARGLG